MFDHIDINSDFQLALDYLENSDEHVFISGKAGTGKSTLLNYVKHQCSKKMVVLAPTGVSALNVQGETVHSFFKFKINVTPEKAYEQGLKIKRTFFYECIDTIIIDEISMLRADLLDCIDQFLKAVLKTDESFGGIQLIVIGDLYQLPPVVTHQDREYIFNRYQSPYFFDAAVCKEFVFKHVELQTIYRQTDKHFIDFLHQIRTASINNDALKQFNDNRVKKHHQVSDDCIVLCTTNQAAVQRNEQALKKLQTQEYFLQGSIKGSFETKRLPVEQELILKIGAKVMMINNDAQDRWVNGSIGEIVSINPKDSNLTVALKSGMNVSVEPHQWDMYTYIYDEKNNTLVQEKKGSFTQYPLQLAWAITIHKSQGKTFEHVAIDLAHHAFAPGQIYVALSRCTQLKGITLYHPLTINQLKVDYRVKNYMQLLASSSR